jgi:chemotaxis family two-component system sensor kinase Cph1
MNSVTTHEQSQFSPASLPALEECSEESVYAPGYIQPHGILLILQEPNLRILQVSENVKHFFGISAEALLGQSLQQLFSRTQVKRIAEFLKQDQLDFCNPFELKVRQIVAQTRQKPTTQTFRSTLHRTTGALILELEPLLTPNGNPNLHTYHYLQTVILKLRGANSLLDLSQILAKEIKTRTGFDRVMIYRFEADEHGMVIAEEKEAHLESYLGLHYPATDIPTPARKLFYRNWVRQIPNINYIPVPLLPHFNPLTKTPLDLSDCVLRGVSPYHIEYLQNMGVSGSLTISLIDGKRLWGLIACHHYSPRLVDYETRKTCEFIGQFASIELVHQQDRELDHYRTQIKVIQNKLQQAFSQEPNLIQQVLARYATELLDLVHANGVAISLDQQITLIGQTPQLAAVQDLLSWLLQLHQPEFYFTDCLVRPYPPARAFKNTASGILSISIVLQQKSYHLVWFRPEQIHTMNWAGKPEDAITVDELGKLHLCPRKSFELWKEIVQETSLPWKSAEIEAALMMRNTLMMAVLEFSQVALEQAAERAMIANRAKSQFLAKMSHELRTPLNSVLGFTQIMNRNPNTPTEFQEYLSIISRSGEHLLELINDVLEMSRIEAGQLILTERIFNLHRLLQGIQDLLALKAAQKKLTLTFQESPELPRYICSDEGKLRQILINLVSNAIKFTVHGRVTVRIWTSASGTTKQSGCTCYLHASPPCHAQTLFFAVEDTGCGIDASNWETIFEAFTQTEQGRHIEGTGLGLCISRQFARLMGGDITVQSTLTQGSTFTGWVVVHQSKTIDFLELETAHLITGLAAGQPTYRILVVEDVPENRQLLVTLLESVGFEVSVVENGEMAISRWQEWHPHLILMDIGMPILDGYETTRQIRAQEAWTIQQSASATNHQTQLTKIVALTAYAFETDFRASLEAGCDDYLAKPFTEKALFEIIARHLGVQYCYANHDPHPCVLTELKTVTPQDLKIMPLEWRIQVHEAALALKDGTLRQLMTEIPSSEQGLIEGMISLIDNFQLDVVASLTGL